MPMMRKVHVAEDEMCEYVLQWPSVYGTVASHSFNSHLTLVHFSAQPEIPSFVTLLSPFSH